MAEASMLQENRTTYKSISTDPVPPGLREIAAGITTVVLIAQPVHLYSFIADYLQEQLMARDSNESLSYRMIRNMVENELTYEAMLKRWGVSTALANYAATIIQAVYRGHRARLEMAKKTQEADQVVEEKHSEVLLDGSVYWDEATKAAVCIQRNFRQIAGKPRQEKPPGEPQQRRRPRRVGPQNLRQPSEVVTAPAQLITAYEATAKEAATVVADPDQSTSSHPVEAVGSFLEQETSKPTGRKQSKQSVVTPRKKETKKSVTKLHKHVCKQAATTPRKKEAKQSVTKLRKQASKQGVATSDNEETNQSVTKLHEQDANEGLDATSDSEEANQSVDTTQKLDSTIPLSGIAESHAVVLPIIESLLWYVVHDATRDPVSVIKDPDEVTSASHQVAASNNDAPDNKMHAIVASAASQQVAASKNDAPDDKVHAIVASASQQVAASKNDAPDDKVHAIVASASQQVAASKNDTPDDKLDTKATPKLESLFSSYPNQDGVFTPGAQSSHIFVNDRPSLEADMSAIFVNRYESISVIQPPSRAAIDVDSQEFYQAQECLSFTENERAQLLLNRSSNSIQTGSTRAVSLQSEVDVTRSEIEVARMRTDEGSNRNHNNWAESEPLVPSVGEVDVAIDKDTFDEMSDYDNISDI